MYYFTDILVSVCIFYYHPCNSMYSFTKLLVSVCVTLLISLYQCVQARAVGIPVGRRSALNWQRRQWPLFSPLFVFPFFFLPRDLLSQKECSDQKTYLAKVAQNAQKSRGRHLSRPHRTFWSPLAAILDFAGGVALQMVSECPGATRLVLLVSCQSSLLVSPSVALPAKLVLVFVQCVGGWVNWEYNLLSSTELGNVLIQPV